MGWEGSTKICVCDKNFILCDDAVWFEFEWGSDRSGLNGVLPTALVCPRLRDFLKPETSARKLGKVPGKVEPVGHPNLNKLEGQISDRGFLA